MAKTIIIDTEVKGVDKAIDDIDKIDSAVDGVNSKSISPKFDTAKTEKQLENLQKVGEKIEKVGQGIAGGFSLATGVVGAFGSELGFSSEEIEKAQAKASSFIGILISIKPVVEGVGSGFKLLGNILKTNPLILLATILGGIIVSFLDMGAVIDGIKRGFKAVGDVASAVWDGIVSGVSYAIDLYTQYLDLLTFGLFDINDAYKGYVKSIDDANKAEQLRLQNLEKEQQQLIKNITELKAKAKLLDKEIKLIEKQKQASVDRYDKEIAFAQASGKETYAIEQQKLTDLIEFTRKEIESKQKRYEIEQQLAVETAKLLDTQFSETLSKIVRNETESGKARKKANIERKTEIQTLTKDLDKFETDLEVNRLKKQKENYDEAIRLKEENLKNQQALDELYAEEDKKFRDQVRQEYLDSLKKQKEEEIEINFDALETNVKINEQASLDEATRLTEDLEAQKQLNQMRIDSISSTLGILTNLNELFAGKSKAQQERAFKVQKAINIANAVIDTYRGANSALASSPPPFNFIAMAGVITAGLLNIKKIASTEFNSGASASAGAGSIGSAPSLPQVDTSSVAFQFPSVGGVNQPSTQPLFVSVTEINNTRNRVEVAESNATFG